MARGQVAMQIHAPGRLQDTAALDETRGHHDEVRKHVARTDELAEGFQGVRYAAPWVTSSL